MKAFAPTRPMLSASSRCVGCDEAERCALAYQRHSALAYGAAPPPPAAREKKKKKRAWVTLLSDSSYFSGVQALFNSLQTSDTEYPLVVMVTAGVPEETRAKIRALDRLQPDRCEEGRTVLFRASTIEEMFHRWRSPSA